MNVVTQVDYKSQCRSEKKKICFTSPLLWAMQCTIKTNSITKNVNRDYELCIIICKGVQLPGLSDHQYDFQTEMLDISALDYSCILWDLFACFLLFILIVYFVYERPSITLHIKSPECSPPSISVFRVLVVYLCLLLHYFITGL